MSSWLENSLHQAASSTFESLGFMLPERELSERQRCATLEAEASVVFHGPFDGCLVLRMCAGTLPVIAMNMLGENEPPAEALQRDALGELANVICGNVLPAVAGSREVFRLEAPRWGTPHPVPAGSQLLYTVSVGLDAGRAEIAFYADEAILTAGAGA